MAGLFLVVAVACSSGSEDATPTPTPDVPLITEGEAIAGVQTLMKTIRPNDHLTQTCFQHVGDWRNARATYQGEGRWQVRVGSWTWDYFPTTGSARTTGQPILGRNC